MGKRDSRVDVYIQNAAPFAQPILEHIRDLVHEACPECEEKIKWGFPHFDYKGMMCSMAGFKEHCGLHFWKGSTLEIEGNSTAMGQFGRVTRLEDLPDRETLMGYVREAKLRNDAGVKPKRKPPAPRPEGADVVPDDLAEGLRGNHAAQAHFDKFSPSQKREYIAWLTEAKTEATRTKRLATTLEWVAEGKPRNWKYQR